MRKKSYKWTLNIIPTYTSLLIHFDINLISKKSVIDIVKEQMKFLPNKSLPLSNDHYYIPVLYGGECGPDLSRVANTLKMKEKEVIRLHTQKPSQVLCFSANGQALMGKSRIPDRIGRLETPHISNAEGAVAIVGSQSTIYPRKQPGGWNVIGRTPWEVVNVALNPITPFKIGDWIHFFEIKQGEWNKYKNKQENRLDFWGEGSNE